MGRLGVVMTMLAILFSAVPVIEAAACAAEGCSVACLEESAAKDDMTSNPASDGCPEQHCVWSAGHSHAAVTLLSSIEATHSLLQDGQQLPLAAERLVSTSPQSHERPPRV